MRMTLDIDDDGIAVAKELARRERSSAGKITSRLPRRSLTGMERAGEKARRRRQSVAGFVPFPARPGLIVTDEEVDALRDAEGI